MSADIIPWIAFLLFFLLFWGLTFLEAYWLSRQGWALFARSLTFAISSNLLGLFIGTFVVFVIVMVLFMLLFEPLKNRNANELVMWIGVVLAFIFPPIFLLLAKRLLLRLFKMDAERAAWRFSTISSVLIVIVSIAVPAVFIYVTSKIFA